jgi:hypothetical protein
MLVCSDVKERLRDASVANGKGGCTQRFVAGTATAPHGMHSATLLAGVNDQGCAADAFVTRNLRSQSTIAFDGTQSRYFTILEAGGGRTWLVWKDSVIDGQMMFAPLTGVDATTPTLHRESNRTLIGFFFRRCGTSCYQQNTTRLLTHNTAFMIHDAKLHAIGGRHGRLYMGKEDGSYHTSMDPSKLESADFDTELAWSTPTKILDGRHQGCIDGRVNRDGIAPYVDHGVCEFDGRNSVVYFRGRFHLYVRANPTLGRRFVQYSTSSDLQDWTAFRSIRLQGADACAVNVYTFAAQAHPLRNDRLIAFYPVVSGCKDRFSKMQDGPVVTYTSGVVCRISSENASTYSLAMSCSADGRSWSRPFSLFSCYGRIGVRTASLPVANGLRFTGDRLYVWVHQDVPTGLKKDMTPKEMRRSKLARYELDGAAFRRWSDEACGAALTTAPESDQEVIRLQPHSSSKMMKQMARLWYSSHGDGKASTKKELLDATSGWCGSSVPSAPWTRSRMATRTSDKAPLPAQWTRNLSQAEPPSMDMDAWNDDFWFQTTWMNGMPYRLHGRIHVARNGSDEPRVVCKLDQERWCRKKDAHSRTHACCRNSQSK